MYNVCFYALKLQKHLAKRLQLIKLYESNSPVKSENCEKNYI